TVLTLNVSPGQYVPAAAPLVTIADLSQLWVRVPVPEQYLPRLDRDRPVTIVLKSANGADLTKADRRIDSFEAKPVAAVPQVDTIRHTADMLYELTPDPAKRLLLAKDQMVTVYVALGQQKEETVLPYSAVVFDAYAGTWIYLDKTPEGAKQHVFERRRVELGPTVEGGVVVRPKLKAGE